MGAPRFGPKAVSAPRAQGLGRALVSGQCPRPSLTIRNIPPERAVIPDEGNGFAGRRASVLQLGRKSCDWD